MTARERLLARLAELAGLAEAARAAAGMFSVKGAWDAAAQPFMDFVAAHSPSLMGAVWEGLEAEVRRHRYVYKHGIPERNTTREACTECGDSFDAGEHCPFVLRWASRLGVGDGDGGTEDALTDAVNDQFERDLDAAFFPPSSARHGECDDTCTTDCGHCKGEGPPADGGGERGTPAGHGDSEGDSRPNGPAAAAPRLPLDAGLRHAVGGPSIEELIERSSLGEPDAVAARATVSDEQAAEVVARSKEPDESIPDGGGKAVCPARSTEAERQPHVWRFDGDDPYIICNHCDEMRDSLTGHVIRPPAPSPVGDGEGGERSPEVDLSWRCAYRYPGSNAECLQPERHHKRPRYYGHAFVPQAPPAPSSAPAQGGGGNG